MAEFDESKIKRDGEGKFAPKDTPAEEKRAEELLGVARKKFVFTLRAVLDEKDRQVVVIDLDRNIQKELSSAKTANEQRNIIFDYIMKNLRGKYPTNDGQTIIVSRTTANKFVHNAPEIKLRAAPELLELIKAGQLKNIANVQHSKFQKFIYYDVAFKIGADTYTGILNVGVTKTNDAVLYDLNPYNEKSDH